MMTLAQLNETLPAYARDISLNLEDFLEDSKGIPQLTLDQKMGMALAAAYATQHPTVMRTVESYVSQKGIEGKTITAAKAAAAIMAMTNVYYRSVHLVQNTAYARLPANLRMNILNNPGVSKQDFELYALTVSAINGCGACLSAHTKVLETSGLSEIAIQYSFRIASIVKALAQVLSMESLNTSDLF